MRLVSYDAAGAWRAGLVIGSEVLDLQESARSIGLAFDGTLKHFLEVAGTDLPVVAGRLHEADQRSTGPRVGLLEQMKLGPPVPDPDKVLCVGLNYADHVAEGGRALPKVPDLFAKFPTSLIGPEDDIDCAAVSDNLDYEGEMAIVIGRRCRHVHADEALTVVAGLTVLNDVSARDLQWAGTQWLPGKAVDRSTPCGPALVTLDEVGDPHSLSLVTRVNGEVMQASNTSRMIFKIPRIIEFITHFLELSPGDVIATGTPEGIGGKRQPPVWLTRGDAVEVEIERVGTLRNDVR